MSPRSRNPSCFIAWNCLTKKNQAHHVRLVRGHDVVYFTDDVFLFIQSDDQQIGQLLLKRFLAIGYK